MLLPATAATKFALATVTVMFGSFTETLVSDTVTSAFEVSLVTNCTTAVPCDTKALVGLGKFSFISVPSTNTTNSCPCRSPPETGCTPKLFGGFGGAIIPPMLRPESTIPAEPLIGRELIPSTKTPLLGEYVPRSVVIDQFVSVDLMTSIEFLTLVSVTQNGHNELDRASNDVKSISPAPPVHAFGSFAGSLPENENFQVFAFKSIST